MPVIALILTSMYCRGVYGYIVLGLGVSMATLMQLFKSPMPLALLLLVPPTYAATRASMQWDGHQLIDLAAKAGRPGTVSYRLNAEEQYISKVKEHNETWGFGGIDSGIFDFFSRGHLFPDGWWIHILRDGGVVGICAFFFALFLLPAFTAVFGLPLRSIRGSPISSAWGLALFIALHQTDSLHNRYFISPTGLMGGSLVGIVLLGRASARKAKRNTAPTSARSPSWASRIIGESVGNPANVRSLWIGLGAFVAVLAVLATPEVVGFLTGNPPFRPSPPRSGSPITNTPDGRNAERRPSGPKQDDTEDLLRRLKEWDEKSKLRKDLDPH